MMPKPLRTAPPSSAIARLLEGNAAVCAMEPQPFPLRTIPPHAAGVGSVRRSEPRTGEPANVKRELVLTPSADQTLAALVNVLRDATGAKLTHSHVARAILRMLADRLPAIRTEAASLPACRLPSNAPGHEAARDRLEQLLANTMVTALTQVQRSSFR
jgi:hypothetical protein